MTAHVQTNAKGGGKRAVATMHVRFTVTDGAEERQFVMIGEGEDSGDKATYKAMTGAQKYALLKLFLISTGDDPEADGAKAMIAPPKPATPPAPKPTPPAAVFVGEGTSQNHRLPPREPGDDREPAEGNVSAMVPPCPECGTSKKVIRSKYAGKTWACLACKARFGPPNGIPKEAK
jgi:hypothetical protein